MFGQREGSTLCPGCGGLVGVRDEACYHCGRRNPGMWGLAHLLRGASLEDLFVPMVMWGCGALFLATLAIDRQGIGMQGLLGMLSPSGEAIFTFGASGAVPVFRAGRWWTVLSASWLHGGVLHIIFNMVGIRDLGPPTVHFYGAARTIIIYVLSGAVGFVVSSAAGEYAPGFLPAARVQTLGASASLFGLVGAILYYGRRGGSAHVRAAARGWILGGIAFGFMLPGIDNFAHLGGLGGGYLTARWLDPLRPERGDHVVIAVLCLALTLVAIVVSVLTSPFLETMVR